MLTGASLDGIATMGQPVPAEAQVSRSDATPRAILDILEETLLDRQARARRERVVAADGRSEDEVRSSYAELDEVIALLRDRLNGEGADETSGIAAAEIHADDELHVASEIGDVAAPPLPEDTPTRPKTGQRKRPKELEVRPAPTPEEQARRASELLYEDVLWLFSINDGEGALVSLERLLMLGHLDGESAEFVRLNEEKLLNLYQGYMGPFDKVPKKGKPEEEQLPQGHLELERLIKILKLVNGKRTIAKIIKASPYQPLETCAGLEQLKRSRIIEF